MVSLKARKWVSFPSAFAAIVFLLTIISFGLKTAAAATTHYIAANGSDSNNGTSKTSPWLHAPGMPSCTGNCAAYSAVPGDTFVMRGCDVWTAPDMPISWNWSGSSGSPITLGVDKTWYNTANCPSGWNRPILDAQGATISGSFGWMIVLGSTSATNYINIDNLEFKGFANSNSRMLGCYNACTNFTFSNNYFHAFAESVDDCYAIDLSQGNRGGVITNNVFSGSDRTGPSAGTGTGVCYAFYFQLPSVMSNNVIHDMPNGIVGYQSPADTSSTISGNLIYNMIDSYQAANHANAIEIVGGGTYYIHANVIHDNAQSGGENLMLGNSGETSYVWNNLFYNLGTSQAPNFPQTSGQGSIPGLFFWNNTIVTSGACFFFSNQPGATFGTIDIRNNHCVGSAVYGSGATVTTLITTPNTLMSAATAAAQGYAANQTYAYSPTSGSNSAVRAGANLTGSCSGSNAGLCADTTYACAVNSAQQVVCPARTSIARPTSTAWDAGAYQYASGTSGPNPPTGLSALVQ
jgi:hypothetical protein